jgi:hypothetical protein
MGEQDPTNRMQDVLAEHLCIALRFRDSPQDHDEVTFTVLHHDPSHHVDGSRSVRANLFVARDDLDAEVAEKGFNAHAAILSERF